MSGESLFHVPYTTLNFCSRFKLLFSRALVCHWILMILNIITYNEDDLHIDDFELTIYAHSSRALYVITYCMQI